jgi:predicted metal-dependent phosphoesterase TrpH
MTRKVLQFLLAVLLSNGIQLTAQDPSRALRFPDIPGFLTLKCDLHMHTVFSDGKVWPDIRVQEALRDGLDAISITDHIEIQKYRKDIPHPDRNRSYELAMKAAKGSGLLVVNGAEITRSMPPGHFNAIFLQDVNKLKQKDVMEVFREAGRQGAFVFWNHPHWTSQQENGIATLQEIHHELIKQGLLHGIEIYNEFTYSDEAVEIALEKDLTMLGTSDIHDLIDWQYDVPAGGHRPVTLVFAREKTGEALKEALFEGRTVVCFEHTLVGRETWLLPLVRQSVDAERKARALVEVVVLENRSSVDFILENRSEFTLHNQASVFTLEANNRRTLLVKNPEKLKEYSLRFEILNAFTAPGKHPVLELELR